MKYRLEYSQIVRKKLKNLKLYLAEQYGEEASRTAIKRIMDQARKLQDSPDLGIDLSARWEIDTGFRDLLVNHYHLFYYQEGDRIIVAEMFGEKEDFMYKLFGLSGRTKESIDYWGE
ncbi:type II toxin-antitoxin system RelE/ParE family toxin [[Clostridium] aminophilum]|uniref:type II toxin-antitoxin system RelE/ParE family toxin n=1 Tax=[Clostridium] aminophilum TaxID=1526 RepID=UPI00332F34A2